MIRTKSKQDSLSTLIKKLDTVFSEFIRLRDCDDNGTVTCFVTGERVWWRDADAAHLFVRQHMGTRFNELNVHACSVDTNRFDRQHQGKYIDAFLKKYGQAKFISLEGMSRSMQKFTRTDIEDLIETYSEKVKQLKKQKHL